jgi:hypothetical protein
MVVRRSLLERIPLGRSIALALLGLTWVLQGLRRAPEIAPAPAASLD